MTALRTTRSDAIRRHARQGVRHAVFGAALLIGVTGCTGTRDDAAEADAVPYRSALGHLPPPATDRIECKGQILTLYELPDSGRWMVHQTGRTLDYPVGPEHTLPQGVNPDQTFVYYTRPGGQVSYHVTLAQIQAARPIHTSH